MKNVKEVEEKVTELSQVCESTVEYTYDDYYDWLFTERVELIFGKVLPMAAPNRLHQTMARNLTGIFHLFFKVNLANFIPLPLMSEYRSVSRKVNIPRSCNLICLFFATRRN